MRKQTFSTDWLGTIPVFYNEKTGKISHQVHDVIDLDSFAWHTEGLYNYLDFGFSVFGQTPIQNVKFLPAHSEIHKDSNGKLHIKHRDDVVDKWAGVVSDEDDILHKLKKYITDWEKSVEGDIVLPISGGLDSRLLSYMVNDKSRILGYTYGVSKHQSESMEVIHAKKVAEILDIKRWQNIEIGNHHKYIDDWYDLYGPAVHAHGMYHIEFYKKILRKGIQGNPFLSGIIGDAWAGAIETKSLSSHMDLESIGYTHGLRADPSQLIHKHSAGNQLRLEFWENNKHKINDTLYQTVALIRFKMILLTYLIQTPGHFGFKPWSPYLLPDIALGMMTLPPERRKNRIWQREFFAKHGLDLESMHLKGDPGSNLNHQAMLNVHLKPLSVDLLKEIINPEYVEYINRNIFNDAFSVSKYRLSQLIRKQGMENMPIMKNVASADNSTEAYNAYLCLYPLQKVMERRNAYVKSR